MTASSRPAETDTTVAETAPFRVGRRVPRNVYEGDTPLFVATTDAEALRIVALLNAGSQVESPDLSYSGAPMPTDGREGCVYCGNALEEGETVLPEADGGLAHKTCCGPERDSYVGVDGEPLKDGDPIPAGFPYKPPAASKTIPHHTALLTATNALITHILDFNYRCETSGLKLNGGIDVFHDLEGIINDATSNGAVDIPDFIKASFNRALYELLNHINDSEYRSRITNLKLDGNIREIYDVTQIMRNDSRAPVISEMGNTARIQPALVDPDRMLKETLFACVKDGANNRQYGGVLVSGGRRAWIRFTTEPDIASLVTLDATRPQHPSGAWTLSRAFDLGFSWGATLYNNPACREDSRSVGRTLLWDDFREIGVNPDVCALFVDGDTGMVLGKAEIKRALDALPGAPTA